MYHLHSARPIRASCTRSGVLRTLGRTDPVEALEALLASEHLGKAVDGYAPQLPLYDYLRKALAQLRAIQAAGGWGRIPPGGTLRPGMRDTRVQALRARLTASGDLRLQASAEPDLFDEALEAAVTGFQTREGLEPDGAVGRRTLQALNVQAAERIEQVRVNLERLRWVAQELKDDYLLVDIAGFSARLYLDGRLAWSSRVVVGRLYRKTPAFRATMRSIILNSRRWIARGAGGHPTERACPAAVALAQSLRHVRNPHRRRHSPSGCTVRASAPAGVSGVRKRSNSRRGMRVQCA